MKINLSKEHLENGCGLIDGYCIVDKVLYCSYYERSIYSPIDPLYEHFLQLVIKGINRSYALYTIRQDFMDIEVENTETGECDPFWHQSGLVKLTEAKEKAISYVFDNMEGKL